ncbi:MAG: RluA family pseudouridine synthase [Phaeodactylibacter sp.]|uniref:RluA family pseudouridine synthase n=1 Tax=Phaeodactylibacter sp. TaxID=1940289 RepID=UPI0032F00734
MPKYKPEIIYQDDELLVVNKPTGLLTLPDRFKPDEKPNLKTQLDQAFGKVWTVHRLDRETSGLLVFALNEESHRSLSSQFQERTVEKTYLAILDGCPSEDQGTIDRPLGPNPAKPGQMMVVRKGKPSVTHFKVIEAFRQFALVSFQIETGRTHQIRVHAASIGHPLAVDAFYGRRENLYLSEIKRRGFQLGKTQEERPLLSRIALHSSQLSFTHPTTQELLTLEAPLPKDLRAVLNQLRKWGKTP